jgi:hypothetical protein
MAPDACHSGRQVKFPLQARAHSSLDHTTA